MPALRGSTPYLAIIVQAAVVAQGGRSALVAELGEEARLPELQAGRYPASGLLI
jgi:hypothetical protein